MKMKYLIKGSLATAVVVLSFLIGRNASVNLTIEEALLQMGNTNYIPQMNSTYNFINLLVWVVAFFLFCLIWRKEIKQTFNKQKTKNKGE